MATEVLSVLRGRVRRGVMTHAEAEGLVASFLSLPITLIGDAYTLRRAWQLATELGLPTVYDAVYLAVAIAHDAPYWTADSAFYERAKDAYPSVRLLGDGQA
jgi:predicted nucleic acid-binding protein